MSAEEPFLARWSRRKQQEGTADEAEPGALHETPPEEALSSANAPEPTDADMPSIETLGDDDDYSGFFGAGVSEALRRQALARLFRSPKFNITDGLDDYAEDYTQFAPLGDIVTADMKHQLKRLAERLEDQAEEGSDTQSDGVNEGVQISAETGGGDDQAADDPADEAQYEPSPEVETRS